MFRSYIIGVLALALAACGERESDRPIPKLVLESPRPATIELSPELRVVADGLEAAMAARKQHKAEIQVALQWLESVRHGVPAKDRVLDLPLVSVVPPCETPAPCARQRIEAAMSTDPTLVPNIVASDLIAHFYHSRAFASLGTATHVNVRVDESDITFAVMPDANGRLAIVGIEIVSRPKT